MIPSMLPPRKVYHSLDIAAENLPLVFDGYKKGTASQQAAKRKIAPAVLCDWPDAMLYSQARPCAVHQVEAG